MACMSALVYVFVGFWDEDYVSQLPYVCYYVVVKNSFKYALRIASPREPVCFRCLMFSLLVLCVAFLTVFVNCLWKQLAIFLGVVVILLLSVRAVLCWIYRVWSSKECVCCACDTSVHLDAPFICFVCVCVCRKLSPHLRAGSQVFALLMLLLCVMLHTM